MDGVIRPSFCLTFLSCHVAAGTHKKIPDILVSGIFELALYTNINKLLYTKF